LPQPSVARLINEIRAFWRYRVFLQRKKCYQQIIGLNSESFPIAVSIDDKASRRV
jgi:hypothetical protein